MLEAILRDPRESMKLPDLQVNALHCILRKVPFPGGISGFPWGKPTARGKIYGAIV
jgi:hypothetical protein